MNIRSTTDYSIFKTLRGNRDIYQPHVKRLRNSILKRNMLDINPIKVNDNMEVIDGQHRLEVAKELQIPIYYIVIDGDLQDTVQINANNRGWQMYDYLKSFVELGKPDYVTLMEFAQEHRISNAIAMRILSGRFGHTSELVRDFKDGNWKISNYDQADRLASLISEVRKHSPDNAWQHHDCVKALAVLQDKVDPKLLIEQLDRYGLVVTRRNSVKDYLRQFEGIINSGKQGRAIYLV